MRSGDIAHAMGRHPDGVPIDSGDEMKKKPCPTCGDKIYVDFDYCEPCIMAKRRNLNQMPPSSFQVIEPKPPVIMVERYNEGYDAGWFMGAIFGVILTIACVCIIPYAYHHLAWLP
jgi:hypothetical protein